jgi:hypothetical protein
VAIPSPPSWPLTRAAQRELKGEFRARSYDAGRSAAIHFWYMQSDVSDITYALENLIFNVLGQST